MTVSENESTWSLEQASRELEMIEQELARELHILGPVRRKLVQMYRDGSLTENERVSDWLDAYACYRDWLSQESHSQHRKRTDVPVKLYTIFVIDLLPGDVLLLDGCTHLVVNIKTKLKGNLVTFFGQGEVKELFYGFYDEMEVMRI